VMLERGLPPPEFSESAADTFRIILNRPRYTHTTPSVPLILPPAVPGYFVGRDDDISALKQKFGIVNDFTDHAKFIIVRGWPGVGKTSLVSAFAHNPEVTKAYPDGILWTALAQKPDIMSILASWGRAFGRDDLLRLFTLKEMVEGLRAIIQHRRMLLIVDDVWDATHAVAFQLVRGENCDLLMTTRSQEIAEVLSQSDDDIYTLPVLTEEAALSLFRHNAPEVVSSYPDECRELIRDLECLPLALHVASRLLRKEFKAGMDVKWLINDLRDGAALITARAPVDRADVGSIPTVQVLLKRSTDLLDEETRGCFAYLGVFAPKPATFDLAAAKAIWQVNDPQPIVRELIGQGLLEPAGDGRFQMHALLVAHAKTLMEE
jgi:hypothetical protein